MINSKLWRLLALIFAISLAAASCSSDGGTDTTDEGDSTATTAAADDGGDDEPADTEAPEDTEAPAEEEGAMVDESLDPVKIGLIAQDEELYSAPEVRAAVQAYVDYANAELDGINGHSIELDVCGAGDSPESHVACVQQFANDDSISLVLNGALPGLGTANSEGLSAEGVPTITLGSDFGDYFLPGVAVNDPGLPGLAAVFFVYASQNLGLTEMSLFVADDPAYLPFIPVLEAIADANGITLAESIPLGFEPDLTGPVSAASLDSEGWLFVLADGAQCSAAAAAAETVGFEGQLLGNDLCLAEELVSSGDVDGWAGAIVSAMPTTNGEDAEEIARIVSEYGGDMQTAGLAGWAFGSADMARDILVKAGAGDADRASVLGVMETYSNSEILGMPPISCPGPGAWAGACNMAPLMAVVENGTLTTQDGFVQLDFTDLDFLLEG